jgi:hypothetical protein
MPAGSTPEASTDTSGTTTQQSAVTSQSQEATEVPASTPADCTPGETKINGIDAVQHCGPASGEFTVGGKTVKVAPGKCEVSMGAWVINVGATVVDPSAGKEKRSQVSYLGIVAGKPGGTSTQAPDLSKVPASDVVVAFTGGGIADSIASGKAKLKFAADGQSGTFSGPTFGGATVTGKFDCGK